MTPNLDLPKAESPSNGLGGCAVDFQRTVDHVEIGILRVPLAGGGYGNVKRALDDFSGRDGWKRETLRADRGRPVVGLRSARLPIVVPRAHDCITFYLGSRERYRDYFEEHPGTYWYSPGWIETSIQPGRHRYEALLRKYIDQFGEDNARYLAECNEQWMSEYSRASCHTSSLSNLYAIPVLPSV